MKKLALSLVLALVALTAFAANVADYPRLKLATNHDADGRLLIFANALVHDGGRVEVQRKLFPWGWRHLGYIGPKHVSLVDSRPAKRRAWYRARWVEGNAKGKWCTPIILDPGD